MLKNLRKMTLVMLTLFVAVLAWAAATGNAVKEKRSWDFTKGGNHATEVTDCDYWAAGSKGRYSLAKDITDMELPSNTGGALSGMEGIYLTAPAGTVYGVWNNPELHAPERQDYGTHPQLCRRRQDYHRLLWCRL